MPREGRRRRRTCAIFTLDTLPLGAGREAADCRGSAMRIRRLIPPLAAAVAVLTFGQAARADLLIEIDKSTQRMTVTVDGRKLYEWPVATGADGYDTPSGEFKPFRMEIDHYSEEWDNAPMPYSIFFTMTRNAVHGTYEQRSLGHAVSHGCVRLSVKNAANIVGAGEKRKDGQHVRGGDGRHRGCGAIDGGAQPSWPRQGERPPPPRPHVAGPILRRRGRAGMTRTAAAQARSVLGDQRRDIFGVGARSGYERDRTPRRGGRSRRSRGRAPAKP